MNETDLCFINITVSMSREYFREDGLFWPTGRNGGVFDWVVTDG